MALDTQDKKFITNAIVRAQKDSYNEFERRTGVILEEFQSRLQLVTELIELRPTREEVGEKIDGVRSEISGLRSELHGHIINHEIHR